MTATIQTTYCRICLLELPEGVTEVCIACYLDGAPIKPCKGCGRDLTNPRDYPHLLCGACRAERVNSAGLLEDDDLFTRPPRNPQPVRLTSVACRVCNVLASVPADSAFRLCAACRGDIPAALHTVRETLATSYAPLDRARDAHRAARIVLRRLDTRRRWRAALSLLEADPARFYRRLEQTVNAGGDMADLARAWILWTEQARVQGGMQEWAAAARAELLAAAEVQR